MAVMRRSTSAISPSDAPDFNTMIISDRKSTRLNSSHLVISYAVFCLKKKTEPSTELAVSRSVLLAEPLLSDSHITPSAQSPINLPLLSPKAHDHLPRPPPRLRRLRTL